MLKFLDLNTNRLTGSLSSSHLGNWRSLQTIYLGNNLLTGRIPSTISHWTHVLIFKMESNLLTGSIPIEITSLPISLLMLNNNQLTGVLPVTFNNMTALTTCNLQNNHLSGTLPEHFETMVNLNTFMIENNMLIGSIPQSMSTLRALGLLYLNKNYLTNTVPAVLEDLRQIVFLSLSANFLSGTLSSRLSGLHSLEVLFFFSNLLSGSVDSLFDSTRQSKLKYVDLSNNELHGSLPVELFKIDGLRSFAAVSNCFNGAIPVDICGAGNLTSLALDGLMSATSCQKRFFPSWTHIQSYGLTEHIAGGVPSCLFGMPLLETLHLSGNGLTGGIDANTPLSASLSDLSLSHNNFQGPVPSEMHRHQWLNLDLSYNKFGGTLSSTTPSLPPNASLSLQVNRLSGVIPSSLRDAQHINILDGNLFECYVNRQDLPINDNYRDIYGCGANTFNFSMYVWIAVGGMLSLMVCFLCFVFNFNREKTVKQTVLKSAVSAITQWLSVFDAESCGVLMEFGQLMRFIRLTVFYLFLFILFALLPVYSALSQYYDTYTFESLWTVTGVYMSGVTPTVVMLIGFIGYGTVFYYLFVRYVNTTSHSESNSGGINNGVKSKHTASPWKSYHHYLFISFMVLVDLVLVTGVNVAYVYITHNYDSNIVHVCQVFVALFKVIWNNFIVSTLLRLGTEDKNNNSAGHITLAVFVILFNNIAAPFIATAYVSSNCFYSVVVAPPVVDVSYNFASCLTSNVVAGNSSTCYEYDTDQFQTISYSPPFIYSYQCSSTFVTTYASIYVFMFTIEAFATPVVLWVLKILHGRSTAGTRWRKLLITTLPRMLLPVLNTTTRINSANNDNSSLLVLDPPQSSAYFQCDAFIVRLLNLIAILSTFGVILPPVAVVCCVATFSVTFHNQLLIGRFVTLNPALQLVIESECSGASNLFVNSVWIVVPFTALFYALFLFDTLGDAVGWRAALWAPLLVCTLPLFARLVKTVSNRVNAIYAERKYKRSKSADGITIQYSHVNSSGCDAMVQKEECFEGENDVHNALCEIMLSNEYIE